MFSNLLNNASRRTPQGGDIVLAMAAGDGDEVAISVAHEGVGIAPDALPHIFDLFTLDTNMPLDESGLGIGLAVVHELVTAHGGSVTARSDGDDRGTEFVVRLPRAVAARRHARPRRAEAPERAAASGRSPPACRARTRPAARCRSRRGRCLPCARAAACRGSRR